MESSEDRFKSLEKRISDLEEQVHALRAPYATPPLPPKSVVHPPPKPPKENSKNHVQRDLLFNLVIENWPAKLGVFLILMSLGWFLGYAVMHDWFSDLTRCVLCLLMSLGVMGAGIYLMPRKETRGEILTILGSIGAILTLWVARVNYQLISPLTTAVLMVLAILVVSFIAWHFKNKALAFFSTVLAMLVPLFIDIEPSYVGLMSYIALIDIAALLALIFQGWSGPFFVSCASTMFYQVTASSEGQFLALLSFTAFFFLLFVLPWILGVLRGDSKWEITLPEGLYMIMITCVSTLAIVYDRFPLFLRSESLAVLGGISLLALYFLSKRTQFSHAQKALIWILAVFTGLCFFFATTLAFTGPSQQAMLFAEVWLAVLFTYFILKAPIAAQWVALGFIISIVFSLNILLDEQIEMKSATFWILILAAVSTASSAWVLRESKIHKDFSVSPVLFSLAGIYLLVIIWHVCHDIIASEDTARGLALIIYTLIGVLAFIFGKNNPIKKSGLVLIGMVILRLLLIEVWEMSVLKRIATFLSIGVLLLLTTFIEQKQKKLTKEIPSHKKPPPPFS